MSILIKGAAMPKNCLDCLSTLGLFSKTCPISDDSNIDVEFARHHIYDDCPLVEIPPHGDLIDKNALMESIEETYCTPCPHDGDYNYCKACSIDDALDAIDDTPTVIESEEQEHGDGTTQD